MAVIKEICDRVAVMEHGVVVESGSILDIFAHPKADATKKFIQSTSAISKIYEMVENNHVFTQVSKGQWLIHLKYGAGNTKEAMLSHICANIGVEISIIYGNVEVIHDTPFGDMVVILDASDEKKQAALDYLEKSGVEVEVIRYDCVVKQLDAECR